jgi:FkbM family methyltransferase
MNITLRGVDLTVGSSQNDRYWQLIAQGQWEPQTFRIFERFLDHNSSYIDLGAFIGPTLLYGCQIAKRAYAIEADPIAFRELKANVDLNRHVTGNVHLSEVCIARHSGIVSIGSCGQGGDSVSSLLFGNRKTHWTVPARSFDDYVRENAVTDCNFIKIDIEGGEYQVLPTMFGYLKQNKPTLHLSLHPCHLGKKKIGWVGKVAARFVSTLRIRHVMKLYKHIYDNQGRPLTFMQVLWICLRNTTVDVVLTDLAWSSAT